jgi:hypothetical protein
MESIESGIKPLSPRRVPRDSLNLTKNYSGQVFVVYSIDDKIRNLEVIVKIAAEIVLLSE